MQEKKEENGKMGARIQKARLAAGLTQEKFGELVGLSAKNISMIECGVSGAHAAAHLPGAFHLER